MDPRFVSWRHMCLPVRLILVTAMERATLSFIQTTFFSQFRRQFGFVCAGVQCESTPSHSHLRLHLRIIRTPLPPTPLCFSRQKCNTAPQIVFVFGIEMMYLNALPSQDKKQDVSSGVSAAAFAAGVARGGKSFKRATSPKS
jgi:hypothetical protein